MLGLAGLVLILLVLARTTGLGPVGWLVGLGCGVALYAAVAVVASRGARGLGPADVVTLARATLSCSVAALVADSLVEPRSPALLVALSVTALMLDLVDGWVARRTATLSTFGARFDGEADAFLMLVLSVHVAMSFGVWVLAIGAVRYVFGAAGLALPWMRQRLPSRYWRKVVTATSGVVLVLAASSLLPTTATRALLLLVVVFLAESFGRDVWWLARHRAASRARAAAYGTGGFVGQEGFMRAEDILALAYRAGVTSDVSVLDACCGVGGPGLLVAREFGCTYLGVDASPASVEIARGRAGGLSCRFEVAGVPPLPRGPFDVVLLLETMLAFPRKDVLLGAVADVLAPGGRFAFTVEEGAPLTDAERAVMPAADTVWPVRQTDLMALLGRAGLRVAWAEECTRAHLSVVDGLVKAYTAGATQVADGVGREDLGDMLAAHRLWSAWLANGRMRKLALVAVKDG